MKYIDLIAALFVSLLGAGFLIALVYVKTIEKPMPDTIIVPEQIEADYAGKLFLQGRIKSIDETELERMSPAIREAVNKKL